MVVAPHPFALSARPARCAMKPPTQLSEELSSSQARLQALMSKQGRCSQFSSQADRDAFLKVRGLAPPRTRARRAGAAACLAGCSRREATH